MSIEDKTVSQLVASGEPEAARGGVQDPDPSLLQGQSEEVKTEPRRREESPRSAGVGRTSAGGDAPPVSSGRRTQANRSNARRSTGPRTERGKGFSSRNAVKHGLAAGAGRYLMRALGEDPEQFDALSQRLVAEWRPQTETARQLVDQLAELFWKQARVARAEQALMARQVEELEASRGKLGAEVGRAHCRGLYSGLQVKGLWWQPDSPGRFEDLLAALTLLRAKAEARCFSGLCQALVSLIWGEAPTLEGFKVRALLAKLAGADGDAQSDPTLLPAEDPVEDPEQSRREPRRRAAGDPAVAPASGSAALRPAQGPASDSADRTSPGQGRFAPGWASVRLSAVEADDDRAEGEDDFDVLMSTLEGEIRHVRDVYRFYQRTEVEITPALRHSQLSPAAPQWPLVVRQRNSVFRQIERTLMLLTTLSSIEPGSGSRPPQPPPQAASGKRRGENAREGRRPAPKAKNCKTKPISALKSAGVLEEGMPPARPARGLETGSRLDPVIVPKEYSRLTKKGSEAVIPSPSRLSFRAKRGICLSLRVNSARNLLLRAVPENKADSSVRQRTPDFGMTYSCLFQQPDRENGGRQPLDEAPQRGDAIASGTVLKLLRLNCQPKRGVSRAKAFSSVISGTHCVARGRRCGFGPSASRGSFRAEPAVSDQRERAPRGGLMALPRLHRKP